MDKKSCRFGYGEDLLVILKAVCKEDIKKAVRNKTMKYEEMQSWIENYSDEVIKELNDSTLVSDGEYGLDLFIDRCIEKESGLTGEERKLAFAAISLKRKIESIVANYKDNKDNKALEYFISDVYADPIHFLMEMIQNADDAVLKSKREDPKFESTLKFSFSDDDTLVMEYDELGFTLDDIYRITSIGNSSKSFSKATDSKHIVSIGEKGIGFKSIFALAEKITITSGHFKFLLSHGVSLHDHDKENEKKYSNALFYRCLEFMETPWYSTKIEIKLKNPIAKTNVSEKLDEYFKSPEEVFLFLQAIDRIKWNGDEVNIVKEVEPEHNAIVTINGKRFFRYNKSISFSSSAAKSRWKDIEIEDNQIVNREISICFPYNPLNDQNERLDGRIYSFLPTNIKLSGLPAFINIDAHLKGSRGDINPDSFQTEGSWNSELMKHLPEIMVEAIEHLKKVEELKDKIIYFIPRNLQKGKIGSIESVFDSFKIKEDQNVWEAYIQLLADKEIILGYDGHFIKPGDIKYILENEVNKTKYNYDENRNNITVWDLFKEAPCYVPNNLICKQWNAEFDKVALFKRNPENLHVIIKNLGVQAEIEDNKPLVGWIINFYRLNERELYEAPLFPVREKEIRRFISVESVRGSGKEIFRPAETANDSSPSATAVMIDVESMNFCKDIFEELMKKSGIREYDLKEYARERLAALTKGTEKLISFDDLVQELKVLVPYYETDENMFEGRNLFGQVVHNGVMWIVVPSESLYKNDDQASTYTKWVQEYCKDMVVSVDLSEYQDIQEELLFEMLNKLAAIRCAPCIISTLNSLDDLTVRLLEAVKGSDDKLRNEVSKYILFSVEKQIEKLPNGKQLSNINKIKESLFIEDIFGNYHNLSNTCWFNELKAKHKDDFISLISKWKENNFRTSVKYGYVSTLHNLLDAKGYFSENLLRFLGIDNFDKKTENGLVYVGELYNTLKNSDSITFVKTVDFFYRKEFGEIHYPDKFSFKPSQYFELFDLYLNNNTLFNGFKEGIDVVCTDDSRYNSASWQIIYTFLNERYSQVAEYFDEKGTNIYVVKEKNAKYVAFFEKGEINEKPKWFFPESLVSEKDSEKLFEAILKAKHEQLYEDVIINLKDALGFTDIIPKTGFDSTEISAGIEEDALLGGHEKLKKQLATIKPFFQLRGNDFAQHFHGMRGYGYTCPLCGSDLSDLKLTAFRVKRKIHESEKYVFFACGNCYELLKYSKVKIIDFEKIISEFEHYYESDRDSEIPLPMKTIKLQIEIVGGKRLEKKVKLSYFNLGYMWRENKKPLK
jgi:hypothetical protein